MLTVLGDSIYNIQIFFQQKITAHLGITHVNFNKLLTNDIVSFEQLGPECAAYLKPNCGWLESVSLDKRDRYPDKYFSYFWMKTYVVGTH